MEVGWRNISNLRHGDDAILLAKSKNDLNWLVIKVKESAKAELYSNIKKTKIMAIEEIYNCNIDNEDAENVQDLAYCGSAIKSNWDCSQVIERRLRLGRA